jgi:hypothetical protein
MTVDMPIMRNTKPILVMQIGRILGAIPVGVLVVLTIGTTIMVVVIIGTTIMVVVIIGRMIMVVVMVFITKATKLE